MPGLRVEVTRSHRVVHGWRERLKAAVPFGLASVKPQHFRDMLRVVWANRDNLGYGWKVLSRGVCDGCALGVSGFHDWTIKGVHLCMTRLHLLRLNTMPAFDPAMLSDVGPLRKLDNAQLRELGRLGYPLLRMRGDSGFRRIRWEEAIQRVAARIRGTDPRRVAFFLTARGITNEVYYVAQKAARYIGTNHVDNASRLCHAPSTGAMRLAMGAVASTCSYRDWFGTDLVVFFGSNPANDQPVTTKYLHEAKRLGTKVVLVNPYREPGMDRYWVPSNTRSAIFGTELTDYWFPVTTGGDIAFLYGVLKILIAKGWLDRDFISTHTVGFETLRERVEALDWATLERQAGLPWRSMEEFALLLKEAKNAVFVWSMGITQHVFGGDAVSMILNVGLARGYVGREKNGLMPIRGHSSVQGGAEMGAFATAFPGLLPINPANAASLSAKYGFEVPDWRGLSGPEMVESASRGELDVLYCLGANFLRTLPDPAYVGAALENVPMRVHQDVVVTDQMLLPPREEVLLLPARTRYEQEDGGIETTTERRILFSPEIPREVGEARTEWRILRDLALAVRPERAERFGCETGWKIREEIAAVVSFYEGVQNLRAPGDELQYGGPRLFDGGRFATPDGKAHFRTVELPSIERPAGEFEVSTRRGKQFNTLIYQERDPLTGAMRDAVFMNPDDAAALHVMQGDRIALVNDAGRLECRVFLAPIARGNLQVHWPEGNVLLVNDRRDPIGGVPDYNARVRIELLVHGKGQPGPAAA